MCTHLQRRGNRYYLRRVIPVDLLSAYGRREFTRALGTSDYAQAKVQCRRLGAQLDEEFEAIRAGKPIERPQPPATSSPIIIPPTSVQRLSTVPPSVAGDISLSKLTDKWEAERKPSGRSVAAMRRVVARFEVMVGKIPAPGITKAHGIQFKNGLLKSGQTAVNTNKQFDVLNALLNYGVDNGDLDMNPVRGIRVAVKRKAKDARHPFDLAALQAIFSSPVYSGKGKVPDHIGFEAAYWIPLLALFYGARREELCQLRPQDVGEEIYRAADGREARCWVIRITDGGDAQGVKNVNSVRRVPLHPELIARGFLDFAEAQRGKARLFWQLKPDEHGDEGAAFGKWFSKHLRQECGVMNRKMVFHSFRHSFKDYCREMEIPEEVSDALSGHSSPKVSRRYGGLSYPLRPLVEAVHRYRIPGLVLPGRT